MDLLFDLHEVAFIILVLSPVAVAVVMVAVHPAWWQRRQRRAAWRRR